MSPELSQLLTEIRKFLGNLTILGVITGFLLSQVATSLRDFLNERKQARRMKTLLSLELNQNLQLLQKIWDQASAPVDQPDPNNYARARRLAGLPLPSWSHKVWESQIPLIVVALSEEKMHQVHDFHTQLDLLTMIHSKMGQLLEESAQEIMRTRPKYDLFGRLAPSLWDEFEKITKSLIQHGNLLIK